MILAADFPDIPDFLRVTGPGQRSPLSPTIIKTRRATKRARRHPFDLPRNIEPAGWALLKQIEKEKRERRAQRFAVLREKGRANRRAKIKPQQRSS